jgi:hypothetical protein
MGVLNARSSEQRNMVDTVTVVVMVSFEEEALNLGGVLSG